MKEVPLADNFADNLQAVLNKKSMSQRELARLSGVHFVTINRILSREMDPSLSVCEKIVVALGFSPEKFFRESVKTA